MKYVVVLGDGMADEPMEELGGRTPLEAAETPVLDRLAPVSEVGLSCNVPEGMAPGSDTANLSVIGYDPKKYYTGRSPLEALSIGVDMKDTDVAMRCNLVTVTENGGVYEEQIMKDHSSSEISTEDAAVLLKEMCIRDRDGYYISDSGSANGIVVNNRPVLGKQLLHEKDVIVITNSKLIFTSSMIAYCCYTVSYTHLLILKGMKENDKRGSCPGPGDSVCNRRGSETGGS